MGLLQISEPGLPAVPLRQRAAGIDLGTTHSLVATVFQAGVETITDYQGQSLLPSVVHYHAEGVTVGWPALQRALFDPLNTILSVKRLLGRSLTDLQERYPHLPYQLQATQGGMPLLVTQQGVINPLQVCAEILKVLALRAEQALAGPLAGVVITVPAYFDDAQRQSTKDAARLAGLPLLRLLNEPTAAALAYGLQYDEHGVVVIYDLGGGTFDISILQRSAGVFEVLATGGNSALGGDDFDQLLATWLAQQAGWPMLLTPALQRELLETAINVKVALSEQLESRVQLGEWQGVVTRPQFEQLIEPLVQKTLIASQQLLVDAAVTKQQISKVVLVGGATRTPLIRRLVARFFDCQPLTELDPDRVVAIGAALHADQLIGNPSQQDQLLLDVTPLSLGIETMGGLVQRVIPRNTTIPATCTQVFTTFKSGQDAMMLHVVQGERERVVDCRSLARFTLQGIPPLLAGCARISVTFQVDADGLLRVIAMEQSSGVQASIQVKPTYGLSEQEIHSLITASVTHADEDHQ